MTSQWTVANPRQAGSAFDFLEKINRCTDIDQAMDCAVAEFARRGFNTIFVAGLPRGNETLDQAVLAFRTPASLMGYYRTKRIIEFDPIIKRTGRSLVPFEWSEIRDLRDDDPRVRELWGVRSEFSLHNGFVVPIHRHVSGPAGVSLGTDKAPDEIRNKPDLALMALYLFDRVACLCGAERKAPGLTEREKEVLTCVAVGKTAWEIGEILGIAKRTVDEHTHSAGRKLGAVNRVQAVAIALRSGLIAV